MLSPFDWQEAINNRAGYVLQRIESGSPVLAVSIEAGILICTYKRQSQKIFEIYDRLAFAGLGQQSDLEAIRVMSIEFAHHEGYNRSTVDVSINRVVSAMSGPVKRAFTDISVSPMAARCLFAEMGDTRGEDQFYSVDFDGEYVLSRQSAVISGRKYSGKPLHEMVPAKTKPATALKTLSDEWARIASDNGERELHTEGLTREVLLIERGTPKENRFVFNPSL
jgi:proteasome alpha subunit